MDELMISGKRYISSRRIARDNGYTSDYVGQLVRAGKIKGQKVGRAWYVDAETFASYLGAAPVQSAGEESPQEFAYQKPSDLPSETSRELEVSAGQTFAEQTPALKIEEIKDSQEKVEEPVKKEEVEEQVEEKVIEATQIPGKDTEDIKEEVVIPVRKIAPPVTATAPKGLNRGLRFIPNEEPLLPEITPKANVSRPTDSSEGREEEVFSLVEAPDSPRRKGLVALMSLGLAVFIFSAIVSSTLFQNINIHGANPASISYGFQW